MSAATKADLARAGTMELTAKEGEGYLDKNLTTWKKPLLMNHFDDKDSGESSSNSKMAKHTTMVGTAEEAKALLDGEVLGDTRQETKKKKQSLAKNSPKKTNISSTRRTSTIDKVVEEAKAVYNDLDTSGEGRSLRKRSSSSSPKKSVAVKRAGTMVKTAEEGKEFVKRGKKASSEKGKKATAGSDGNADD